jgi:hypothetical protein
LGYKKEGAGILGKVSRLAYLPEGEDEGNLTGTKRHVIIPRTIRPFKALLSREVEGTAL